MGLDCAKDLPTDAGTAEMAAIANAKATVILDAAFGALQFGRDLLNDIFGFCIAVA